MSLIDHHLQNGGSPVGVVGDFPEVKPSPSFLNQDHHQISFPDILQTHQDHKLMSGQQLKDQKVNVSPTDLSG